MRCVNRHRSAFTLAEVLAALAFMAIVIPIAVVMFFPNGIAGLWEKHGKKLIGCISRMQCVSAVKGMIENKRAAKVGTV